MKTLSVVLLGSLLSFYVPSFAQTETSPINIPSPNASNLWLYEEIPVNNFTGVPNISIPLYTLSEQDITVPITLSYHTASIKLNNHPGWTGLGWTLGSGGAITRVANGNLADEVANEDFAFGFYASANRQQLSANDWDARANIENYALSAFDESADKFVFNFNGYSGEFYLDYNGEWVVKSEDKITVKFDPDQDFINPTQLRPSIRDHMPTEVSIQSQRYFHRFTLITANGTRYIFGGNIDAVEYSVPYRRQWTSPVTPTSWYLTEIISPKDNRVTFAYAPKKLICTLSHSYSYSEYSRSPAANSACNGATDQTGRIPANGFLIFPVYLTSIKGDNITIDFESSASEELGYDITDLTYDRIFDGDIGATTFYTYFPTLSFDDLQWQQLDDIIIRREDGTPFKQYHFTYTDDPTTRLKLNAVQEIGLDRQGNAALQVPAYQLSYHATRLPGYNSDQTDHWGYYNGFDVSTFSPTTTADFIAQYPAIREPDGTGIYQTAEMLQTITYPTGGITTFEFEPHQYAQTVLEDRETLDTHENRIAGGVRIKKITTDPVQGEPIVKQYHYVKEYTPESDLSVLKSSGILAGKHQYWWPDYTGIDVNGIAFTYSIFSSGSLLPFAYNNESSPIGYSEVIAAEKNTQGTSNGYTKYTYTNFDTDIWGETHMDEPALEWIDAERSVYSPFTSKALERGKLTSTEIYANGNIPVKHTKIKYAKSSDAFLRSVDTDRFNICTTIQPGSDNLQRYFSLFGTAYKTYTYDYRPERVEERSYDESGSNYVATITDYRYDNPKHKQLTQRIVKDSQNRTRTTLYQYAEDFTGSVANQWGSNHLRTAHMHNVILKEETKVENSVTGMVERSFIKKPTGIVVPEWQKIYPSGSTSQPIQTNFLYSDQGNLLQEQRASETDSYTTSYLWGYNQTRPVARIEGATYNTVSSGLTAAQLAGIQGNALSDQELRSTLAGLRSINNALVTLYTHNPLFGITSQTAPNGLVSYFEYDDLGRLNRVRDHRQRYTDKYLYHYQGQAHPQ